MVGLKMWKHHHGDKKKVNLTRNLEHPSTPLIISGLPRIFLSFLFIWSSIHAIKLSTGDCYKLLKWNLTTPISKNNGVILNTHSFDAKLLIVVIVFTSAKSTIDNISTLRGEPNYVTFN